MAGKIISLLGVPNGSLEMKQVDIRTLWLRPFVDLRFSDDIEGSPTDQYVDYFVKNGEDGYKYMWINNQKPSKDELIDEIMLVIPYGIVKDTSATRIAGRYMDEGIYIIHNENYISVQKGNGGRFAKYKAVLVDNELYLVELSR